MYYAKIGGFLCYMAPFLIVLFNEKMLDFIYPVFNAAAMLKGLDMFDMHGMKGEETNIFVHFCSCPDTWRLTKIFEFSAFSINFTSLVKFSGNSKNFENPMNFLGFS